MSSPLISTIYIHHIRSVKVGAVVASDSPLCLPYVCREIHVTGRNGEVIHFKFFADTADALEFREDTGHPDAAEVAEEAAA